jgi:probable H4MPT-linked C1 transfer pathway protein
VNSGGRSEIVGVDVGGANLKYAGASGTAYSRHFAMWRHPETLADTLVEDLNARFDGARQLAITMTGELADCFIDRGEGVDHIVRHVGEAARRVGIRGVQFYGVDGQFRCADDARVDVDQVASANWHALASFVASEIVGPGKAVLIDIGSTTTDVVPVCGGRVATNARTDYDRMREGSLVYVGCRRTPVCALVDRLRFRGQDSRVMNERFATIDDARVVLGIQSTDPQDCDTADGKPRTAVMAANRLARMIGLDRRSVSVQDARELAIQVHQAAKQPIAEVAGRMTHQGARWIISGHGDDLIDLPSGGEVIRLAERLGTEMSRCAPSYSVAKLLQIHNLKAAIDRCAE